MAARIRTSVRFVCDRGLQHCTKQQGVVVAIINSVQVDEVQRLAELAAFLQVKADEARAAANQLMVLRSKAEGLLD